MRKINNSSENSEGLKSIKNLKPVYSSESDNLLEDFFIPCLNNSIRYDRISGFFSSILYTMVFRGIKNFVLKRNSKMRLIIGYLPQVEKEILSKNREELKEYLNHKDIINDINEQFIKNEPLFEKNHLKLLGWLILNNKLEIKLALLTDENNNILTDPEEIKFKSGKLHKKIGIFYDEYGNSLSFCGSNNETPYGWEKNFEEFDIHYNWDGPLKGIPWLNRHKKNFEEYWNNKTKGLMTIDLPNKCIEKLNAFAPKTFDDIGIEKIIKFYKNLEEKGFKKTILEINSKRDDFNNYWQEDLKPGKLIIDKYQWEHHLKASEAWIKNNYVGLLEMATGTGKTITAIKCMYHLFKFKKYIICWVLVPDKFLITQWKDKLKEITKNIIIHEITNKISREELRDLIFLYKNKKKKESYSFLIFLSTTKMINKIIPILYSEKIDSDELLLIVDEAHSLGAIKTRQSLMTLNFNPAYKIGLTATPVRYFDPIGTNFILNFFNNKIVFKLTLKDALKKGFLCPYKYYIEFCELTSEENIHYKNLTKSILSLDEDKDERKLIKLYNLRAKIIKNAKLKLKTFDKILIKLIKKNQFYNSLIYCDNHKQINEVATILEKYNQKYRIIDANTNSEERKNIIQLLKFKHINTILAMKCLDQGVDIPFFQIGIFLSNSGNEKEFIQRRGRLLRKDPSKKIVKIYDIIVKKNVEKGDSVFLREKERVKLFSNLALNKVDVDLDYFNELGELL
ncbi:MAG: DEAD/DEAH box helicase family protein [Promethearchaeia archaeon]